VPSGHQYGRPLLISELKQKAAAQLLQRVPLNKGSAYDEAWLQQLIMDYPNLLPIELIEPALTPASLTIYILPPGGTL
jgi:hypothetical protein